jgi:methyl-accepting chemotaxis protein
VPLLLIAAVQTLVALLLTFGPLSRAAVADGDTSVIATAIAATPERLSAAAVAAATLGSGLLLGTRVLGLRAAVTSVALGTLSAALGAALLRAWLLGPVQARLLAQARHVSRPSGVRARLMTALGAVTLCGFALGVAVARPATERLVVQWGALLLLAGVGALAILVVREIESPLRPLREGLARLARGDLRPLDVPASSDDVGGLGAGLRAVSRKLSRVLGDLGEVTRGAIERGDEVTRAGAAAIEVAETREAAATAIATALADYDRQSRTAADAAARLVEVTRRAREGLARSEESLGQVLEETGALRRGSENARVEAEALIVEISRATAGLSELGERADTTAASTLAMDAGIARVRSAAADTASLSSRVSDAAEKGYRAVHHTLDAIERIRDLSQAAHQTIDSLGARLSGIGQVVSVIEEIAQKTNLLALNASIIAAQAGQHGRGMAVVAGEIKSLAQRTASSTQQIADQILGIQHESVRAMETMAAGVDAVNNGFHVAVSAGDALGEIRQTARAAQKRVQSIARTMDDHAQASRRAAEATGDLAVRTREYARSVQLQARTGEGIRGAAGEILDALGRVETRLHDGTEGRTLGAVQVEAALASALELAERERVRVDGHTDFARVQGEVARKDEALRERLGVVATASQAVRHELERVAKRLGLFKR